MRLIDADAITTDFVVTNEATNAIRLYISYNQLKNAPTIDPVKHGQWLSEDALFGGVPFYCSVCEFGKRVSDERRYKYCPNCGAKMDEVSK